MEIIEENEIKIIIPVYNAERWIEKCMDSVISQDYMFWDCIVLNDASTDKTGAILEDKYAGHPCITVINNEERVGALENIVRGISAISDDEEDIIILLDGDDWLAYEGVFKRLDEVYTKHDVWLTYGQYRDALRDRPGCCNNIYTTSKYRKSKMWKTSHLKTFKKHIWDKIKDEDLRDEYGDYYPMAWDMAIMYPLVEMCGLKRLKFIYEILCIYNNMNPLNDEAVDPELQRTLAREIQGKPVYSPIE